MEETFEQKVIRNVQGNFAVYKTTEVVGDKSFIANLEWAEPEEVDKFFMFAKNLGAKVIYITEGDDEDEETGQTKNTILQVGFLYEGVMHHIDYAEEEEDIELENEDEDEEDDEEYEYTSSEAERQQELPSEPEQPSQPVPPSQPSQNLY